MRLEAFAWTDPGPVRENNEDTFLVDQDAGRHETLGARRFRCAARRQEPERRGGEREPSGGHVTRAIRGMRRAQRRRAIPGAVNPRREGSRSIAWVASDDGGPPVLSAAGGRIARRRA